MLVSSALAVLCVVTMRGRLIMDEVDTLLHPLRSELNVPLGGKTPIDLTGDRWDLPIHLLDLLFAPQVRQRLLAVVAVWEKTVC